MSSSLFFLPFSHSLYPPFLCLSCVLLLSPFLLTFTPSYSLCFSLSLSSPLLPFLLISLFILVHTLSLSSSFSPSSSILTFSSFISLFLSPSFLHPSLITPLPSTVHPHSSLLLVVISIIPYCLIFLLFSFFSSSLPLTFHSHYTSLHLTVRITLYQIIPQYIHSVTRYTILHYATLCSFTPCRTIPLTKAQLFIKITYTAT